MLSDIDNRRANAMINPYEPPKGVAPKSFWKRLKKALEMAATEYREGLKREGFDTWTHLQAWLGLAVTGLFVLFLAVAVVILALVNSGLIQ